LLFFLIVFVRDDLDPRRERHQAIQVIAVTVGDDGRRYRLRRDFGNLGEQIFRARVRLFGIDNDDARLADDDRAISTSAAKTHPHIGFKHFHRNRRRRRLRCPRNGERTPHHYGDAEAKSLRWSHKQILLSCF